MYCHMRCDNQLRPNPTDLVVLEVDQVVLEVDQVVLEVDQVVLEVDLVVLEMDLVVLEVDQVVLEVDQVVLKVDLVVLKVDLVVLSNIPPPIPSPPNKFSYTLTTSILPSQDWSILRDLSTVCTCCRITCSGFGALSSIKRDVWVGTFF